MEKERPILNLWPNTPPGKNGTGPEDPRVENETLHIYNTTVPSLNVYHATGDSGKTAPFVIVSPGGCYNFLSWDKEGEEIAEWLNSIGFSAGVLKYRTPDNREGALQDIQRAMGLVRQNARNWNIDTNRIGAFGFSAGAHLSAHLASNYKTRSYEPIDEADTLPCRPDFTVLVYPAFLGDEDLNLNPEITVDGNTPPTFIIQTQDDIEYVHGTVSYYTALFKQGTPTELHLYQEGGHGYGLRSSDYPAAKWTELCRDWLLRLE